MQFFCIESTYVSPFICGQGNNIDGNCFLQIKGINISTLRKWKKYKVFGCHLLFARCAFQLIFDLCYMKFNVYSKRLVLLEFSLEETFTVKTNSLSSTIVTNNILVLNYRKNWLRYEETKRANKLRLAANWSHPKEVVVTRLNKTMNNMEKLWVIEWCSYLKARVLILFISVKFHVKCIVDEIHKHIVRFLVNKMIESKNTTWFTDFLDISFQVSFL